MAHLEALREVLPEGEEVPEIFLSETRTSMSVLSPKMIQTDASDGLMQVMDEAGFFMPEPERLFVHYEVEEREIRMLIQGTSDRPARFYEKLQSAASRILPLCG